MKNDGKDHKTKSLLEPSVHIRFTSFELMIRQQKSFAIKDRFFVSGNMSKDKFIELISEKDLNSSDMIIMQSVNHACCLRFEEEN